ncbi:hypothetical protein [Bacillus altitudinis]|uniref:hypothetical protein n=1 Tax=Bacillus altitudinis TaxID=293387 RepID=UPI002FFEBC1B
MEKWVKLKHVQELLELMDRRDAYYDWSTEHEKLHRKVKKTIEWLERNAKEMS